MCTGMRFSGSDGSMYFGRNLDWSCGYGEKVIVTPAESKVPAAFNRPSDCRPGHAVIGMGIIEGGMPLYFDCGNDAGLAVAGLNFPQSASYFEVPQDGKTNVAAYEFPFWAARNFSSVTEMKAALAETAIVGIPVSDALPVAYLHWMVSDASGSIVVECMEDGLRIWENDTGVLTNEPDFGWQRQNLRNYMMVDDDAPTYVKWRDVALEPFGLGSGMHGIPGDYSGPSRFVKAAFVNGHYPIQDSEAANVTRMFRSLWSVAVPEGCVRAHDASFEKTVYTSCFSAKSMTYYYAAYGDLAIKSKALGDCPVGIEAPFAP